MVRRDEKVPAGTLKWMDCGLFAWRRRQRALISFEGSADILGTSRKEFRVLTPGGGASADLGVGGGGGDGQGEAWAAAGVDDGDEDGDALVVGEGGGVSGPVAPGTMACFLNSSILSLYCSFNSKISFLPSSFAFDSSFSLYLAMMRSWVPWVARNRTSWT